LGAEIELALMDNGEWARDGKTRKREANEEEQKLTG
jgi:hypothetical protein